MLLSKVPWCLGEGYLLSGSHEGKVTSTDTGEMPKIKFWLHLLLIWRSSYSASIGFVFLSINWCS